MLHTVTTSIVGALLATTAGAPPAPHQRADCLSLPDHPITPTPQTLYPDSAVARLYGAMGIDVHGAATAHDALPPVLDYRERAEIMAAAWHAAGHPVPADYLNADAQPSSPELREYQQLQSALSQS